MLVLKRKIGETIKIGDEIEVHVLAVEGDVIKLGFTAPRDVQILRSELYKEISDENILAGNQAKIPDQLLHLLAKKKLKDDE